MIASSSLQVALNFETRDDKPSALQLERAAGLGQSSPDSLRSRIRPFSLQITSQRLLALDGLEQRFEIAFAKTLRSLALNDFEEQRGAIFHRLGENLQQISFVIAIHQNAEPLERAEFLVDVTDAIQQRIVIGGRDVQELHSPCLQIGDSLNDVVGGHGDVLHAFAV